MQLRTLAFAEFQIPIQVHLCAAIKHRKTPKNKGGLAPVELLFKSHRSASRSAVSTCCRCRMYSSSWTHRRTNSALLSDLGQRRWETAQHRRQLTFPLVSVQKAWHRCSLTSNAHFSVQTVLPNPSLKLTPNGMARRPIRAGASPHFARPGRRAMPLGAA